MLRVPVQNVKAALSRLTALGTIVSQNLSVTDLQHDLQVETAQIAELRRTIAALTAALRSPSLPDAQRVILQIRLANAKRSLSERLHARTGTIAAGTTARLSLTLFLWFVTLAYLVLRSAIDEPDMRARYSAVLAVLAALLIPFIHLSVYLFRTLHPMPIVLKPDKPSLPSEMLTTFTMSVFAFLFFCGMLIRARYRFAGNRSLGGANA